jgi:site-specific DNA recombinase
MNPNLGTNNAVGAIRISSLKQGLQGDSPQAQKDQLEQFAKSHNINIKKFFFLMESASKDEQPMQEVVDYCKDPKNGIQLFVIKSIDRFTRGGSYFYDHLKMQLTQYGVKLIDIYGIIGNQQVNTLEHLGVEFPWSIYSPTKKSEILEAERAKDEIRDILSRMIGAEIRYVRMGYPIAIPPFGYQNEKVETDHGKRVTLAPSPKEAKWVIKMFELRARGTMTDQQIVDELNNQGFRTRKQYKRHPVDKTKIIGTTGNIPLNLKAFWKHIENPTYTGVYTHKWTENKPIKGQFKGLISYETFNKANRGKITVTEVNGEVRVDRRPLFDWQLKKTVKNPEYPYKRYVLCPECEKPFFGSASKGRHGGHFPAYHCSRNHKYLRIQKKTLEETIHNFVKGLKVTKKYREALKKGAIEEWERRMNENKNDSSEIDNKIRDIQLSIDSLTETIKKVAVESVIKSVEADILKAENDLAKLKTEKEKKETEYINMEVIMDNIDYFLKHIEELLLGTPDPLKRAAYFGILFTKAPTYNELLFGTPQLEDCIALNGVFETTKSLNVDSRGLEPLTSSV